MPGSAPGAASVILGLGAAVLALLAYLPALSAGFTSDDFMIVALLQDTGGLDSMGVYFGRGFYDYYRPVAFLSHGLDWELWGAQPIGFHLTSIVLHGANTGLVYVMGRRLLSPIWALAGALLFGLHPSSHEAVYWVAARFDLLATFFGLIAIVALTSAARSTRMAGVLAFALALLSKESATAIPLIVAAYDVWIARRSRADVVRRLVPLLVVLAGYAVLRAIAADVAPAGGRVGKLLLFGIVLAAILLVARSHASRPPATALTSRWQRWWTIPALAVGLTTAAALTPATALWMREKLAFIAYATFHLLTPIAYPPPPAFFVNPATPVYWLLGLAALAVLLASAWMARDAIRQSDRLQYLIAFTIAALVPVSTMTGGTRYLYLATAGVSLGAAWLAQFSSAPWSTMTRVAIVSALAVAPMQIVLAGRSWIWASEMSADAAAAAAPRLSPCGSVELVLLTAPVQIRGVYSNLNAETFNTRGCEAASVRALTRVVRDDVAVEMISTGTAIEWRVPVDRGNIVASADLRTFDRPLRSPLPVEIATPIGRLESRRDGDARLFRFEPSAADVRRVFAYYGNGRVRLLPRPVQ
jgi:hypothetical protein